MCIFFILSLCRYTRLLLTNKVKSRLIDCSCLENLENWMVWKEKNFFNKKNIQTISWSWIRLSRLSRCCIKTNSIGFNPWKLSLTSSLTPGMLFNERKASPAKSFAVITSWSITVNPIIAGSCVHCSTVIVPNSKHSSKTGLRVRYNDVGWKMWLHRELITSSNAHPGITFKRQTFQGVSQHYFS